MKKPGFLIAIIIALIINACSTPLPPEQVMVEQGIVQGIIDNDLRIFKGIPFAAPPIGDLRWKAPQPAQKWEGIKEAFQYGPSAYQGGNPPSGKRIPCAAPGPKPGDIGAMPGC